MVTDEIMMMRMRVLTIITAMQNSELYVIPVLFIYVNMA